MLKLDGSELCFVYLFGFVVGLWFKRLLVAPAIFLVLQSAVMFPLYFVNNTEGGNALFHVSHGVTVCAGSVTGVFFSYLTNGPKLIRRRSVDRKNTLFHAALVLILVLSPWTFVVGRDILQPQFSFIPAVAITLAVYAVAWRVWVRQPMFDYFPCVRKMRLFVAFACAVQVSLLLAFAGIDALFQTIDDAYGSLGFALRIVTVTVYTLVVSVARFMAWRRTEARVEVSLRQHYALHWNDIMDDVSSSSSSEASCEEEFIELS